MKEQTWMMNFPGAITLCDREGIILYMNAEASRIFNKYGGSRLIGSNVLDCHPASARSRLKELLEAGKTNVYTVEKNGAKRLIYQAPWYEAGRYSGFVELSVDIPLELPNFLRSGDTEKS